MKLGWSELEVPFGNSEDQHKVSQECLEISRFGCGSSRSRHGNCSLSLHDGLIGRVPTQQKKAYEGVLVLPQAGYNVVYNYFAQCADCQQLRTRLFGRRLHLEHHIQVTRMGLLSHSSQSLAGRRFYVELL